MRSPPRPDPAAGRLLSPDGSVTIPPSIAREVLRALLRDLTARVRADGGEVSPGVRRLLLALHTAAEQRTPAPAGSVPGTPLPSPGTVEIVTGEAAALLGCSSEFVRRLCRTGRLRARRDRWEWRIDACSLDDYRHGEQAT